MELKVVQKPALINEMLFEGSVEQPVEWDFILPESCPDIEKLLKCIATPSVTSKKTSKEGISLELSVSAQIFYVAAGGEMHCATYSNDYQKNIDIKSMSETANIDAVPTMNYLNCRAANPRRLDMRGAMDIKVIVTTPIHEEIISDADGAGIQLRRSSLYQELLKSQAETMFDVDEELELGRHSPPVKEILRTSANALVTDIKVITGKVIIKGDIFVKLLYNAYGGEGIKQGSFTIPVSQILDVPGASDGDDCFVGMDIVSSSFEPLDDMDGEAKIFGCKLSVAVTIKVYGKAEEECVTDAFSTMYDSRYTTKPLTLTPFSHMIRDQIMLKEPIEMGDVSISEIIDIWADVEVTGKEMRGNSLFILMSLSAYILYLDEDKNPSFFETTLDFDYDAGELDNPGSIEAIIKPVVGDVSYMLLGPNRLELRTDIKVSGVAEGRQKKTVLGSITVDENSPRKWVRPEALTIYYSDGGENVWDIAKRYNTSADAIMRENNLDTEVLAGRQMILIP